VAARRKKAKATRKSKAQREFISEAEETVEKLRENLSELYEHRSAGNEVDPDLINGIFRAAHSLKGLAGMFGFDGLSDLAHHLEDILDGLRLGRVSIDAPAVDLLDEAVSVFATLLGKVGDSDYDESAAAAISDLFQRIEGVVSDEPHEADDLASLDLEPTLLRALTEYEEHRLRENLRRGRHISLVDTTFEIIAFEEGLSELSTAIREVGEVVSTLPSPGDAPESQIRFSLLVATEIPAESVGARLDFHDTTVRAVTEGHGASHGSPGPQPAPTPTDAVSSPESLPPLPHTQEAAREGAAEPVEHAGGADIESLRSISDTVRVDIHKLDELMNLVGELVIQRSSISQIANRLSSDTATARIGVELTKAHKLLDRKLKDLQAGVLDVRMVPLRQVFEKLSRVMRRLRRDMDKDVELEFKGADTELDKLIVEQLIDPLMHLVRNAFDHAVEPPEQRRAAGKPTQALIRIEASQRGNHVVIEVSDDGKGMDPDAVRTVAETKGLVTSDEILTAKETLDLVFAAGMTTREEVSDTSGRGVGMDVVRSNMTAMGGIVDLSSELGRGTTVTLTLPITLAIIQALIVGADDQRFAIPLTSVLETMLVDPSEIQRSEGREILNLRGDALLLRRLSEEFGLSANDEDARQFVVVLGLGEQRVGLIVDRLDGQQDTVIKPIQGPVQQVRGIAGATELGDQGAVLVLDISSIVEDTARRREVA